MLRFFLTDSSDKSGIGTACVQSAPRSSAQNLEIGRVVRKTRWDSVRAKDREASPRLRRVTVSVRRIYSANCKIAYFKRNSAQEKIHCALTEQRKKRWR